MNARALSDALSKNGFRIVSAGTDNHLFLVDLTNKGVSGRDAAISLDMAVITVNKNLIPFDTKPASVTSGIRIGTPAVTTRGMKEPQMRIIADLIGRVINAAGQDKIEAEIRGEIKRLTVRFPLYEGLLGRMKG